MRREFGIFLRRKVPFLTNSSSALIGGVVLILFLMWLFMIPASGSGSSLETNSIYFILAVPEWVKNLAFVAALALLVLVPLNVIRRKVPSTLTVSDKCLAIENKKFKKVIGFEKIRKIFVNDLTNHLGQLKGVLQIAITYEYNTNLAFTLVNYDEAEELLNLLSTIDPEKFTFFDKKLPADEDDI
jgi:hypothetical protein